MKGSTAPGVSEETGRREALAGRAELALVLGFAVLARWICWDQRPPDMHLFLEPWFAHIVHYGPIQAFAHPFSNYEPAYLYLLAFGSLAHGWLEPMTIIKILSVAGTAFMVWAVAELVQAAGAGRRGALLIAALPSVIVNDALLAQCDALWAGACALALARMIGGRTLAAMIWCGIAISLKAQAAFIAPVMIGAMIGRRAPPWQWGVPAAVFVATLLPAWAAGWPLVDLLTVYAGQAAWVAIPGRLANPWMFGTVFADHAARDLFVLGYVAAGLAAVGLAAAAARATRMPYVLIALAALAGTLLPFLLPKMLERYYFLGDVLTVALALTARRPLATFAAAAVQTASILTHVTYVYFFYQPFPALIGVPFAGAAIVAMAIIARPALAAQTKHIGGWLGAIKRRSKHPHVEAARGRVAAG